MGVQVAAISVECGICLEIIDPTQAATTDCGHQFCPEEILKWVKESENSCPNCRQAVTEVKEGSKVHAIAHKMQRVANPISPLDFVQEIGHGSYSNLPLAHEQFRDIGYGFRTLEVRPSSQGNPFTLAGRNCTMYIDGLLETPPGSREQSAEMRQDLNVSMEPSLLVSGIETTIRLFKTVASSLVAVFQWPRS